MNRILYRDDDISYLTDAFEFKKLHQQFMDKKIVHTAAVEMKDLWDNRALFWYLATAPYLQIGLHGWTHTDYSCLPYGECFVDLLKSLNYWENNAKRMLQVKELPEEKKIKIFFAPWNKESDEIKIACKKTGLKFCNVKNGEWEGYEIRSFHWWACINDNFKLPI